jgi:hypothetical protein
MEGIRATDTEEGYEKSQIEEIRAIDTEEVFMRLDRFVAENTCEAYTAFISLTAHWQ